MRDAGASENAVMKALLLSSSPDGITNPIEMIDKEVANRMVQTFPDVLLKKNFIFSSFVF